MVNSHRFRGRLAAASRPALPEVVAAHTSNAACQGLIVPDWLASAYWKALLSALRLVFEAVERSASTTSSAWPRESVACVHSHEAGAEKEWASVPRRGRAKLGVKHPAVSAAGSMRIIDLDAASLRAAAAAAFAGALHISSPLDGKSSGTSGCAMGASPLCMSALAGWLLEYPVIYDTRLCLKTCQLPPGDVGAAGGVGASAERPGQDDWRRLLADSDDSRSCLDGEPLLLCAAVYSLRTSAGRGVEASVRFSLPLLRMHVVGTEAASGYSPSDDELKALGGAELARLPPRVRELLDRWQNSCRDTVASTAPARASAVSCEPAAAIEADAAGAGGGGSGSRPTVSSSSPLQSVRFEYSIVRRERIVL